ncbi:MAG: hypothetical protein JNK82_03165 [Myxococcaceae bacterium]|nr:hypothetical protein [Myxococcaceae bacterium]
MGHLKSWRFFGALLCLHGVSAHAFKLETHIWVGQSVINDLEDDGQLTFELKAGAGQPAKTVTVAPPAPVTGSILAHRNEYLLGMIGPDAMPDVVVGQTFPHPGVPYAWKANDWLRYVVTQGAASAPTRAYSYGYLGHAASDVWAHTWVNQYAGSVFELEDQEAIVEERHAALEGYVALRQPELKNRFGAPLGKPWQRVQTSDVVATFLRDQLIYASPVQNQYSRSWTGAHLVAFKAYRDGIESAAQSSVWNKIDLAVAKYFVSEYTGYMMSDAEAQALINEVQRLNNKLNQGIDLTQEEVNNLNARLARIDKRFSTAVQNDVSRLAAVEHDFIAAKQRYEQLLIERTCDQIDLVCPRIPIIVPKICWRWWGPYPCDEVHWVDDPVCRSAFQATCRTLTTLTSLRNDALGQLVQQRTRMANELIGLFNDLSQARTDALQVADALVDLQQITTSGSPVQQLLYNWRNDTDRAFAEYTKAASQMMINTMNPDPSVSSLAPLQQWLDCYGASLQGVPYVISNCGNRQALQRLLATLDRLGNLPANSVAISIGLPTSGEVQAAVTQVKTQAVNALAQSVQRGLIGLLPPQYQGFVLLLKDGVKYPSQVTSAFTRPESSPYELVMIPDVVARVDREMALSGSTFNPSYFAPVANAVIYSKLALLDAQGIAQLATAAGVAPSNLSVDNLVIDSVASFDGNHPWLVNAPPYPRKYGEYATWSWDAKKGMGSYPRPLGFGTAAGFPLFRSIDGAAGLQPREGLFLRLFAGPLNPGVEQPREISTWQGELSPLVGASYPYKTCRAAPYPKSLEPQHNQGCPDSALVLWSPPAVDDGPTGCGLLSPGQYLRVGRSVVSCDGRFNLVMQGDSNLVLYYGGVALWASHTTGSGADLAVMQYDGNFVMYRPGAPVWHTSTHGQSGAYLAVQNDGNLVVYQGSTPVWASGSVYYEPPPPTPCPNCYEP